MSMSFICNHVACVNMHIECKHMYTRLSTISLASQLAPPWLARLRVGCVSAFQDASTVYILAHAQIAMYTTFIKLNEHMHRT